MILAIVGIPIWITWIMPLLLSFTLRKTLLKLPLRINQIIRVDFARLRNFPYATLNFPNVILIIRTIHFLIPFIYISMHID